MSVFTPPARCKACHAIFPSPITISEGSYGVALIGNETICPRCGSLAPIVDGEYSVIDATVRVLVSSSLSAATLENFFHLMQEAQKAQYPVQQAKSLSNSISPCLASIFDITNWSDVAKSGLYGAIIVGVMTVLSSMLGGFQIRIENNIIFPDRSLLRTDDITTVDEDAEPGEPPRQARSARNPTDDLAPPPRPKPRPKL